MTTFFGKYRGQVVNNVDPLTRGRVQVSVPSVFGSGRMSWAEACVPYAGPGVGLFAVPPVGANVWVEFEAGDPDAPILTGCFWGTGDLPGPPLPQVKTWKTEAVTITLSDLPGAGGLTIEVGPPAVPMSMKIACTASGIELTHGASSIALSAAQVSINNGALDVV